MAAVWAGVEFPTYTARHIWRTRAEATKEKLPLQLGVWHEDNLIGCQDLGASDFEILKTVTRETLAN